MFLTLDFDAKVVWGRRRKGTALSALSNYPMELPMR
jgi:hypothetical protein